MDIKRDFKGIWIPKEIWLANDLNITEKAFLAEIDSLSSTNLGCFASNKHFSKFSGLSSSRCSVIINDLEKKGYVRIRLVKKKNSNQIEKRYIKINYEGTSETKEGTLKTEGGTSETKGGYFGNSEGINTKDINTINNTSNKDIVEQDSTVPYQEIIDYLNLKTGKSFRNVKTHQRNIKARFNEGYTLEDFKTVIDKKTAEWKDDSKMNEYLRPQTLFGTKFDSYLNQKLINKPSIQNDKHIKHHTAMPNYSNDVEIEEDVDQLLKELREEFK